MNEFDGVAEPKIILLIKYNIILQVLYCKLHKKHDHRISSPISRFRL